MNFWNFVNMRHCVVHVAIITFWILNYNNSSFDLSHLYIHKHTQTRTHTHTHTHTHTCKIKFFNKNIRSNKGSGQTERNKLIYLHYLNKIIEKCKMNNFIFSEVSKRFKDLMAAFELWYIVNSFYRYFSIEAAIRTLAKILKN